jgi:hypothetical protein
MSRKSKNMMGEIWFMETEDWNESPWFREWLEMAREKKSDKNAHAESEDHNGQRDNEAQNSESREFAPPFAEWDFSLRENVMMRLPQSVLALIPPQMAKAYMNTRLP